MTISNEAVEAAAKVLFAMHPVSKGAFPWDAHPEGRIKQQFRADAHAALESAAPIIRAEALERAADDYRHYETPNARLYLRARAAAERGTA